MSLETLREYSKQQALEPQLVLRVDGIPYLFGAIGVEELAKFDEGFFFDDGLFFDTLVQSDLSKDVISQKGTTSVLTQQINIDRGGQNSIQRMTIKLIDEFQEISKIFSDNNFIQTLLGRKAELWLSFKGLDFPSSASRIIKGVVDDFSIISGSINLGISQADKYKEQTIFNTYTTLLSDNVLSTDTQLRVDDTNGFYEPVDIMICYAVTGDEYSKVTGVASDKLTVVRGAFRTISEDYDIDSEVQSAFTLEANPIEIALKLMLSKGKEVSFETEVFFVNIKEGAINPNQLLIPIDVTRFYGVVEGDSITVGGANAGTYVISQIFSSEFETIIEVENNLISEFHSGVVSFKSKYDTLPIGLGMTIDDVDVQGFESVLDLFGANITSQFFIFKDDINAKEFIEQQIFRPLNLYGIVRQGRSSVKMTAPTFGSAVLINSDNVVNPQNIKVSRSINKYYYNTIVYKYAHDEVTDKPLMTSIIVDNDSAEMISVGTKQNTIEAQGLRKNPETDAIISQLSRRFLGRYRFAPRFIEGLQVFYGDGFSVEVGDAVSLDGEDLKIIDTVNGGFLPLSFFEVVNKSMDIFKGVVRLDLLETNFLMDSNYGVFSQSSFIDNVQGKKIRLKNSFLYSEYVNEVGKWRGFEGSEIRIYSEDYSFDEAAIFLEVDETDFNSIVLDREIPNIQEDYILELSGFSNSKHRKMFSFNVMGQEILNIVDNEVFVDDVGGFYVGQKVELFDYLGDEIVNFHIIEVTGNSLKLDQNVSTIISGANIVNALEMEGDLIYRFF